MNTTSEQAAAVMEQFLRYVELSSNVVIAQKDTEGTTRETIATLAQQMANLFNGVDSAYIILALFSVLWHVTQYISHKDETPLVGPKKEKPHGYVN